MSKNKTENAVEAINAVCIAMRLVEWKISVEEEMKNIIDETTDILNNPDSSDYDKAKANGTVETISRLLKHKIAPIED